MATANKEYFDAQIRHQIGVRNYTSGEVNRMMALLMQSDTELSAKLRSRLAAFGNGPIDLQSARWKALVKDIKAARTTLWTEAAKRSKTAGNALADIEVNFQGRMVEAALPIEISMATTNLAQLHAALATNPFSGGANAARTLNQWWSGLNAADQGRIVEALQMGIIQGESVNQMVTRVVGTKAQNYTNGVLATSRRNAAAIVRTFSSFVTNTARDTMFQGNEDIVEALKWNAMLDGRTSAVCRGRDGHYAPVDPKGKLPAGKFTPRLSPKSARPPAHPNCRSVMVAVLDPDGVMEEAGARPFVTDTRTRRKREKDFRAEAKADVGNAEWKNMTPGQRNAEIRKNRMAWGQKNIGTVPPDTDYNSWMKTQPAAFQDDVLGKTKAELFRTGKINLDQFIDVRGHELTLDQLAKKDPTVFIQAGLDPKDF